MKINKPPSTIEITLRIRWINPNLLSAWTVLAKQNFEWRIDRSVNLREFIDIVKADIREVLDLRDKEVIVVRVQDKSNWQDELGLNKLTKDVLR